MIEVRDLTKDYGPLRAIDHLNFSVQKGEVVGFLGPNGAGKSTTMKIITGFMAPSSGTAQIGGYDVFENPIEVKRRIGYLPETPPLYTDMFVQDYLYYVARLKGLSRSDARDGVRQAIEKTSLGQVQNRLIGNLSKGFKQRVGIAQAIVSNPDILILDEPTVGLDPKQVSEIRNLIKELRGQHTIVISTHILPEVQATCERIIIINRGKIVAEDSLAGLSGMMDGSRAVQIRVRRPNQEFINHLQGLEGVRSAKLGKQENEFIVETENNDDVIEKLARHVIQQDVGLLEMHAAQVNLEDIFLKLTYESEGGAGL